MEKTIKVKAIVKVTTEFGKWCLAEIRGLKEGTELEGRFNPRTTPSILAGRDKMPCFG